MEYHYCPKIKRKQRMDRIKKLIDELEEQECKLLHCENVRMEFLDSQRFLDRNARDHTIDKQIHFEGHINQAGYADIAAARAELAARVRLASAV
jgi:hypothetical protein